MQNNRPDGWIRIESGTVPIYIRPDGPDWFVPNTAGDMLLQHWLKTGAVAPGIRGLLSRIEGPVEDTYRSRSDVLAMTHLKECWIHITNRCNMACRHCMFTSSPAADDELTARECDQVIREAYALGCRIFYFTGGEPFAAEAFAASVQSILQLPHTHVVILTNLTLLEKAEIWLRPLPVDRLHFQVSLDGLRKNHDFLRGESAFAALKKNLAILHGLGFPVTLSTTVTVHNADEMGGIVDFAAEHQVSNVHFLWLFKKGNADDSLAVEPARIFSNLKAAQSRAGRAGITIDNVESIRAQVFSCTGTRYDLSNAGWQSLAIGPDGRMYPTPALIYTEAMQCGHISEGMGTVWEKSPVLQRVRRATLYDSQAYRANPFRHIVGGGDIDHSYINSGQLTGGDPYTVLYNDICTWLIAAEAETQEHREYPVFRLKMGEILGECPAEGDGVFFTHSNCVLSLPGQDNRSQVNRFYTEAAVETKEDILNPICYDEQVVSHIPRESRYRSYGCGSPVLEAGIRPGETVVDLGSGTGIECFIASRLVGPEGRVIGIDMGDTMIAGAIAAKAGVAENLHYDNISFEKAFLEDLPLADGTVDAVISNCVVNLSPNKRQVFREIHRILKPHGRLLISDITYNGSVPLDIKYNESLRGECIGGALRYHDLFGLLNDTGFSDATMEKGYLYRTIRGYDFYSISYRAVKPAAGEQPVLYGFPDFDRTLAAVRSEPACACFTAPEAGKTDGRVKKADMHRSGCMVCGAELVYHTVNRDSACHYCGKVIAANAECTSGHFVCDACHSSDAVDVIVQVCLHSRDTDVVSLMQTVRSHPRFPINGPEHHALLPAVILTALRNNGSRITDDQIGTAVKRGQTIAGGACAFFGVCGAAIGAGIALSVLTGATPLDGGKRQAVQQAVQKVLAGIASFNAPRCCQRDLWVALKSVSGILRESFGSELPVPVLVCRQFMENKECIRKQCPLWPANADGERGVSDRLGKDV